VEDLCQARALGLEEQRPVKKPKTTIPHHIVTAAVIQRNGQILIAQRPDRGLLGGMWEFPGGKTEPGEGLETCLKREICEELNVKIKIGDPFGIYEHTYTHFKVTLHAFRCTLLEGEPDPQEHNDLRWVMPQEMEDFPMGKIDRQIARNLLNADF
jgi:A/G-specific adenine glycosylase